MEKKIVGSSNVPVEAAVPGRQKQNEEREVVEPADGNECGIEEDKKGICGMLTKFFQKHKILAVAALVVGVLIVTVLVPLCINWLYEQPAPVRFFSVKWEAKDALAFYRSYFEDAGEGNEASILKELESPEKVAEALKSNLNDAEQAAKTRENSVPDAREVKKENKMKTENKVLWIILAILTSPIWITILAVVVAILVAILACVFAAVACVVTMMAALLICGFILSGVGIGYLFTEGVAVGLGLLGGGLIVLALGILAIWLVVWCFGWFVPWAVKKLVNLCKNPFEKKKERESK